MYRTPTKLNYCWNFNSIKMTNLKKYIFKKNPSRNIHVMSFSEAKTHSIYITDVLKQRLLNISQYNVENKRKEHFQSRHQTFVIKPMRDSHNEGLLHESLTNSLQKCESVNEQIELFHSYIKLPDTDSSNRYLICQELEKILKPYYTSCSVRLVGSSINGLGLKGCDVDLSLQYPSSNFNLNSSDKVASSLEADILETELPPSRLYNFSPMNQLLSIRKILQNLKFEESLTVIPGRCPILNFYHHNLSCDLAINNSSALQGTSLMLLCSKLDERVAKLMRIIIYWAKHSKLIGGLFRFKSYAVFLLVTYFLQTRNPPILPAVEVMSEKIDFPENHENWPCDVEKYIRCFERSKNTQSVEDLLREFYFFYANFDFSYIICPVNSSSVDRKTFATNINCENSFELNTICIQDPFNLAWNVTTGVSWKNCKLFSKALISVCDKYQDSKCWSPGSSNWGLASLIDCKFSYHNFKDIKEFIINVPVASRSFGELAENHIKELESASESVKQILSYCLLFSCYQVTSGTNLSSLGLPQNVKLALQNEFISITDSRNEYSSKDSNSCNDISYVCVTQDTWAGRNSLISLTNNSEDLLENEHTISKKMIIDRGSSEKDVFYFLCQCYTRHLEKDNLYIKFKPLNSNRFIPKLAIFLKEYIPKFMDSFLLNSQKQTENLLK